MPRILSWYLEAIDFSDAPTSLLDLRNRFVAREIHPAELAHAAKWEPLLRGDVAENSPGWVEFNLLASTRRGIATGSNEFFLVSRSTADVARIAPSNLKACIGKSSDVAYPVYRQEDYDRLLSSDAKCLLIDFHEPLLEGEQEYVRAGERDGVHKRYIPSHRRPWYSMEQRSASPVWASVFGRGDLKFVYNQAGVKSLTNFHCVYPHDNSEHFARALVVVMNSLQVRANSRLFMRGFGGGLKKFEPNDLLQIPLPDLRRASCKTIEEISSVLDEIDHLARKGDDHAIDVDVERLVNQVLSEAAPHQATLF